MVAERPTLWVRERRERTGRAHRKPNQEPLREEATVGQRALLACDTFLACRARGTPATGDLPHSRHRPTVNGGGPSTAQRRSPRFLGDWHSDPPACPGAFKVMHKRFPRTVEKSIEQSITATTVEDTRSVPAGAVDEIEPYAIRAEYVLFLRWDLQHLRGSMACRVPSRSRTAESTAPAAEGTPARTSIALSRNCGRCPARNPDRTQLTWQRTGVIV